jgi:hypothetical protein
MELRVKYIFLISMISKTLWGSSEDMSWPLSERNTLEKMKYYLEIRGYIHAIIMACDHPYAITRGCSRKIDI